jgi:hypothetical protein
MFRGNVLFSSSRVDKPKQTRVRDPTVDVYISDSYCTEPLRVTCILLAAVLQNILLMCDLCDKAVGEAQCMTASDGMMSD